MHELSQAGRIQISPMGYISFKSSGTARINHMSGDNSIVIDFFCKESCAGSLFRCSNEVEKEDK